MFDFDDFFGDEAVMLMSHAQIGMYLRLLAHDWREGSIPEKWDLTARLLKIESDDDVREWRGLVSLIGEKYLPAPDVEAEGRITNRRLQRQREEQREAYLKAVERGRAGGKAAARRRREREGGTEPAPAAPVPKPKPSPEALVHAKPRPIDFDAEGQIKISRPEVERLQNDYPMLDVVSEVRKASNWNAQQSPSNRKKKAGAFLINWLNRASASKKAAGGKGRADANLRNALTRQQRLESEGG